MFVKNKYDMKIAHEIAEVRVIKDLKQIENNLVNKNKLKRNNKKSTKGREYTHQIVFDSTGKQRQINHKKW